MPGVGCARAEHVGGTACVHSLPCAMPYKNPATAPKDRAGKVA